MRIAIGLLQIGALISGLASAWYWYKSAIETFKVAEDVWRPKIPDQERDKALIRITVQYNGIAAMYAALSIVCGSMATFMSGMS
jgi:hypothetical protein